MPKKDFIWRGEEIIVENASLANILVDGLNEVFENGFKQTGLDTEILSKVFKPLPETYITASSTKCNDGEFIGRDNGLISAGTYGYIYLVEVEAKNITTVSIPKEKGAYAIVSKIDPNLIVGAMPSAFVAFALGIAEKSFITNSNYTKIFDCEKIKKAIGGEFSLIVPERLDRNLNLPLSEVYQNYLQVEVLNVSNQASLVASSSQSCSSVIFFQGNIDKSSSQETYKSPHP